MSPTATLTREHRVIEDVLSCLEVQLQGGQVKFDPDHARLMLSFFREYADRLHHGKEEDILFPALELRGFSPYEGPTRVMREEHRRFREAMANMAAAVELWPEDREDSWQQYRQAAAEYVCTLRHHIEREDACLFPIAASAIDASAQADLERAFERFEQEDLGAETVQRLVDMYRQICETFGVEQHEHASSCG